MNKKKSFDSEASNSSDCDIEEVETKDQTRREEEDEEKKKFQNIDLIKAISSTLEAILENNKSRSNYKEVLKNQSKMVFSSNSIPSISIEDYLKRIQTYSNIEKNTLITSLIFIDRFCKIGNITLTYYNIHRILFSAVLISIKYNEDIFYDNKYYADIAGVKLKELKSLEYNFVNIINFKLYVADDVFEKYKLYLDNFENVK
jgi:hypothetical protein